MKGEINPYRILNVDCRAAALALRERKFPVREQKLHLDLLEILDALENMEETIRTKEDRLDKRT